MALRISHSAFQGSYEQFRAWRNNVAKTAGYQIIQVKDGCCGMVEGPDLAEFLSLINDDERRCVSLGNWPATPTDPLLVLLTHSDSEGHINVDQQLPLADRLYELLSGIEFQAVASKKDFDSICVNLTQAFIVALETAHAADEVLMFYNS